MRKIIFLLLASVFLMGQTKDASRRDVNLLENSNPGAENSTVKWTCTAGTLALETAAPLVGSSSFSWTPNAPADFCESELIAIPAGMQSGKCLWTMRVGGPAPDDHNVAIYDQTNTIVDSTDSAPTAAKYTLGQTFDCPASGSLKFRITATGTGVIHFDQAFVGEQEAVRRLCARGSASGTACVDVEQNGRLLVVDGVTAIPSIGFQGAISTGIYAPAVGELGITSVGLRVGRFNGDGLGVNAGAVGTPSIHVIGDEDTGVYSNIADGMDFTAGGIQAGGFRETAGDVYFFVPNGVVGRPGLTFAGDGDSGLYRPSTDEVAVTAGGVRAGTFYESGGISALAGEVGSSTRPYYTFSGNTNTGIYRSGTNTIGFAANAAPAATISNTNATFLVSARSIDGTAGAPGWSFKDETTTGIYRPSTNSIGFSTSSTPRMTIGTTAITNTLRTAGPNGSGASPAYGFSSSSGTGMYLESGSVRIHNSGSEVARFGTLSAHTKLRKLSGSVGSTTACWSSTSGGLFDIGECSSSRKFKDNIENVTDEESEKIYQLEAVSFDWKESHGGLHDYGFIAEEVHEVLPELAIEEEDGEVSGVNYRHMVALLQNELKRHRDELKELRSEIERLKEAN